MGGFDGQCAGTLTGFFASKKTVAVSCNATPVVQSVTKDYQVHEVAPPTEVAPPPEVARPAPVFRKRKLHGTGSLSMALPVFTATSACAGLGGRSALSAILRRLADNLFKRVATVTAKFGAMTVGLTILSDSLGGWSCATDLQRLHGVSAIFDVLECLANRAVATLSLAVVGSGGWSA